MRNSLKTTHNRGSYGVPPGQYSEGMETVRGYQDVLRTGPTVPVLLELPKWEGRQILFQDPDGTIPVEAIGDPIGGVRHPLTGAKLVEQTTDSRRPLYGGIGVGATNSGDAYLDVLDDTAQYVPADDDFSIIAVASREDGDDRASIVSYSEGTSASSDTIYVIRYWDRGRVQWSWRGEAPATDDDTIPAGTNVLVLASGDGGYGEVTDEDKSISSSIGSLSETDDHVVQIGAQAGGITDWSEIRAAVWWGEELTGDDLARHTDLMMRLR